VAHRYGNELRFLVTRRKFFQLTAFSTAGMLAGYASGTSRAAIAAAKAPSTIRAAFFVETKPTMIAKNQGWWEKATGAKFEWTEAASGAEVNTRMAARSVDVSFSIGSAPVAAGIAKGIPYQIVALVDNIGGGEDMVVRKSKNITKPDDFIGKKVATVFGSTSHFRLLGFLKVHNLTEKQVTVLDLGPEQAVAAWSRGDIDASYYWDPFKSKMLAMGGEPYVTYKELDAKGYVIADLIIVRTAFLREYPDAVTAIVREYGRAVDLWKSDPNKAAEIVAKEAGVTPDVAKRDMEAYDFVTLKGQLTSEWLGTPTHAGKFAGVLKSTADFLVTQKSIKSAPSSDVYMKAINTSFLQRAV